MQALITYTNHVHLQLFVTAVTLVMLHRSSRAFGQAPPVKTTGSKLWEGCIKFLVFSFAIPLSPPVDIDGHALSSTCPPFAFGPVYIPVPVGIPESYSQCWVGTPWPLQPNNEITESSFGSLSGPRVLITPMTALAQLTRLALPPFRYAIPESSWIIKNGNRGRDMQPMQEIICESCFLADFTVAGQDAIAMVGLMYSTYRGTRLKDRGLSGLHVAPTSRHFSCGCSCYQSKGYFASNWMYLIFLFAGGRKFSRQVSKTCQTI
jgi:hypothetical protein